MKISNLTIVQRVAGMVVMIVCTICILVSVDLSDMRAQMLEGRLAKIQAIVETNHSMAQHFHDLAESGALTEEEARARYYEATAGAWYNGDEYVFAWTQDGTVIVHPARPDLVGQNLWDLQDPDGVYIGRESVAAAASSPEGGAFSYQWPRAGSDVPEPKLSYAQLFEPWGYVIVTGIYLDDVNAAYWAGVKQQIMLIIVLISVLLTLAYIVGRSIAIPIQTIAKRMDEVSNGNLDIEVPFTERRNEVGTLGRALDAFKSATSEMRRLELEKAETEKVEAERRKEQQAAVANAFDARVAKIMTGLTDVSAPLKSSASTMQESATLTVERANEAAEASDKAARNVQAVAGATEELSASITEISRSMNEAVSAASNAVDQADSANKTVGGLTEAAERIGQVVDLITDIAQQTNLLALNATIEAARAGEAGKGFAVVASEVKNLASQTARATEEIADQVQQVQSVSSDAEQAIRQIADIIGDINALASTAAAAVEQQRAATEEISRSVEMAAEGTGRASSSVEQVAAAIGGTGSEADQVRRMADTVVDETDAIREAVDGFLTELRTGTG